MKIKYIDELIGLLLETKTENKMQELLKSLLTISELDEISCRLQIIKLLKKGMSQREIAEKLKVGIATVTRGSNEIKRGRFKNV